jgi:hypothetical protein
VEPKAFAPKFSPLLSSGSRQPRDTSNHPYTYTSRSQAAAARPASAGGSGGTYSYYPLPMVSQ